MRILRNIAELTEWRGRQSNIGFVPTMGALHDGHLSLVQRSQSECETTLVSIFINPTQFNNSHDLQTYPQSLEKDFEYLKSLNVEAVFTPSAEEMYADNYQFQISENKDSLVLEGAHRPGHFNGVLTVVMKLLMLSRCSKCFMGEKDYQQFLLVKAMAKSLFLPVEIIPVPTVREADGLAMSSRNLRLSPSAREKAPLLYKVLSSNMSLPDAKEELTTAGFKVDYLDKMWNRKLVAAEIDGVRLIDNV